MPCDHLISVRVDEDTKRRFRALATREGVSESALMKRLLDVALLGSQSGTDAPDRVPHETRAARLYVRLSPSDRRLLSERAQARSLRAATYVSLVVRAHLLDLAPLPKAELAAMKQSVAQLSAIGRKLNPFVRALQRGVRVPGFSVDDGIMLIKVCMSLRDATKELIDANAASWRGGNRHG